MPREEFLTNRDAQHLADRHFQIGLQCLLDIGAHIIAELGAKPPEELEGILPTLANEGVISREVADRLKGAGKFRNLLVHEYIDIDYAIEWDHLQNDLDKLAECARQLRDYVERVTAEHNTRVVDADAERC
jgi:uncharacterized protein YutE (UPF0331/DUF86 family)